MRISSVLYAFIVLCLAAPLIAGCNTAAGTSMAMNEISPAAGSAGTSSNAVYFGSGSAQLTPEGEKIIRAAATTAGEHALTTYARC